MNSSLILQITYVFIYKSSFSAANSINWGRLLPQTVYHAASYLDLVQQKVISMGEPVDLCIPTGNFGNILAAYYVKVNNLLVILYVWYCLHYLP